MKQIIIINGTYGFRPQPGIVESKSPRDPAFSVDDAEADRLVAMGVASLAGADKDPEDIAAFINPDDQRDSDGVDGDDTSGDDTDGDDIGDDDTRDDAEPIVYNTDMKVDELKEVARKVGATEEDLAPLYYKKDVIGLIDKILAEIGGSEDHEGAPELGAADPV